jgi:hypothetical protein
MDRIFADTVWLDVDNLIHCVLQTTNKLAVSTEST